MPTTNEVNYGKGAATGMFLTAAAGTDLPATLTTTTLASWGSDAGFISEDGMSLELNKDVDALKDWAKIVRRVSLTDHEEKATGACISTDATALTALFGSDAVTATGTTTRVNLSEGDLAATAAYMFVMIDGDDIMAFGCSEGQIVVTGTPTFTATGAIEWPFEITAMGEGGMEFIKTAGA